MPITIIQLHSLIYLLFVGKMLSHTLLIFKVNKKMMIALMITMMLS